MKSALTWIGAVLIVFSTTLNLASADSWQQSSAVQALYEKAKREGEVVVWGTAGPEVNWLPAAVSKVFPGISVKVVGDTNVVTRVIAEARAGRHQVDVFWCALSASDPVSTRNLLAQVDWAGLGIPASSIGLDGRMAYTNNVVYTVVYNTQRVKKTDAPGRWQDLLEGQYKSKMAASPFLTARLVGVLGLQWGEEQAIDFAQRLRRDGDVLLTSALLDQILQSGERWYAIAVLDQIAQQWRRNGAALDYVVPEPVVAVQFGATVLEKAPHPNAARLIAAWMASPEGKRAREQATFASDYRPGSESPRARELYARGAQFIHDTHEQVAARNRLIEKVSRALSDPVR